MKHLFPINGLDLVCKSNRHVNKVALITAGMYYLIKLTCFVLLTVFLEVL